MLVVLIVGLFTYWARSIIVIQPYEQDPRQASYAHRVGLPLEMVNSIGMRMRLIPSGDFMMGSPTFEHGHTVDEFWHRMHMEHPFYMSATEVTQAQYQRVINTYTNYFKNKPKAPADSISWEEAVVFCNALSEREGLSPVYEMVDQAWVCHIERDGYRLPVEAEWEHACRAGTDTAFYTGDSEPADVAEKNAERAGWYIKNAGGHPHAVGWREANAWGLYDMHGNVWEWCWDWFNDYRVTEVLFMGPPQSGAGRSVRGGGWYSPLEDCRCATRQARNPYERLNTVGFRCVRSARPTDG